MILQANDRILVQAAQDGDLDAFEALVRRHQAAVYRVAFRMLRSEVDAQDATQDTFVRAWRGLERFRRESAVSTWLYSIVTRRCLGVIAARDPPKTGRSSSTRASTPPTPPSSESAYGQ